MTNDVLVRENKEAETGKAASRWRVLVDGDEETPFPRASTMMTKYLELSTSFSGPFPLWTLSTRMFTRCWPK